MNEEKLLSVIVPVYKVEPYLHRCIDSIRNQTYKHLQIILVDDGSPDNCGKICDEYAELDARIIVVHQKNRGLSGARNTGLRYAKGEYVAFVDSDDWISSDMYQTLVNLVELNDLDMARSSVVETDGDGWKCVLEWGAHRSLSWGKAHLPCILRNFFQNLFGMQCTVVKLYGEFYRQKDVIQKITMSQEDVCIEASE